MAAPSTSSTFARPQQPRKMKSKIKPHISESKNEGTCWYLIIIDRGQDIEEKILNCLQNQINISDNSQGHGRMGFICSAFGSVLATETPSASHERSYDILTLGGSYTISEDGQVKQCGPLTISCAESSCVIYGGQVNGSLVAAGPVQIVVATCPYNASEDE